MPANRTERIELLRGALDNLQRGRFAAAEATCDALLTDDGQDSEAELLLGLALGAQGQTGQAMQLFDRVADARAGHAHPCRDLAELLAGLGRADEAVPHYQTWLTRAPDDAAAHHAIGLLLAGLGRFPEALLHFQRTVAIDPDPAMGWSNLGMMLKIERRFDASIAAHDRAVARAPEDPQVRVNRAVALLHAERMTEAWGDYEYRLRQPGHVSLPMATLLPDVNGLNLAGRTVLVTHEEGFGDTLQFLRYVPLLAARGARVVLAVPHELVRIVATLKGVSEIHNLTPVPLAGEVGERSEPGGGAARLPDFDFHCPAFSLPRAFATTFDTIPAPISYLHADLTLVQAWSRRLPTGTRVGLVWAGQARPWLPGFTSLDRRRSAGLASFAPLGIASGIRFISLQKGPPAREANTPPPGMILHDPMPDAADFADTAAIIANLDLVVSVDTAVVHLAGALGKPVFLLDRYDNCWRWFSGRQDSPWYPRLRIFRQNSIGDWSPPMRRAAEALRNAFPTRAETSTSGVWRRPRMTHTRIRKFNTRDTYPEQKLDNDLCQAVIAGDTIYLRGQVPQDLDTGASIAIGDPAGQAEQVMRNIDTLLRECGSALDHITKATVYLTDIRYREPVYRVAGRWLKGVFPVFTGLVVVALARPEWLVEIDVIAVKPGQ